MLDKDYLEKIPIHFSKTLVQKTRQYVLCPVNLGLPAESTLVPCLRTWFWGMQPKISIQGPISPIPPPVSPLQSSREHKVKQSPWLPSLF